MRTFFAMLALSFTAILAAPAAQQICTSSGCAGGTCLVNPVQLESSYFVASNMGVCSTQDQFALQQETCPPVGQTYTVNSTSPISYSAGIPATTYSYATNCGNPTSYPVNSCGQQSSCCSNSSCMTACAQPARRTIFRRRGLVRRIFGRRNCAPACNTMAYSQVACSQPAYSNSCATCATCSNCANCQAGYAQPVYTETVIQDEANSTEAATPEPDGTETSSPADGDGVNLPEIPAANEVVDPNPKDDNFASTRIGTVSTVVQRPPMVKTSYVSTAGVTPGIAQQKANSAASMGLRGHVGGSLGGAKFEGVGWSNQSAQHALKQCCYWGERTPAQIGVAQGADGFWYACVLYH